MAIRMYWFNLNNNFGDQLSPMLCRALSGRDVTHTTDFKKCDLVAIGSILHLINNPIEYRGAVWGAGFIEPPTQSFVLPKARVCAVRGRLTQQLLGADDNVATGDPGLLCDIFANPVSTKHTLGIVPHFKDNDNDFVEAFANQTPGVTIVNVEKDVQHVIDHIASCEMILSSSLHGLIVADSLGIPNGWIKLSDSVLGGVFKYKDYYSTFGIDNVKPLAFDESDSIDSIRDKLHGYHRPGIDGIKQRLRETFPFGKGRGLIKRLIEVFKS